MKDLKGIYSALLIPFDEKGEVKDKKGNQFTIVDANGNRHQIKKVDENTIEYQPFTSDGISATNGESFKFKKDK